MSKFLTRRQFGDPILRKKALRVSKRVLSKDDIRKLVAGMQHTLTSLELGVGLAAPQVGESIAVVVINIQPLPHRPIVRPFEQVMINPRIVRTIGKQRFLWESCISSGNGQSGIFAKVPRYPKVVVEYVDLAGHGYTESFSGLPAQVVQHEIDHLNGILFVDRVKDPKTYMTYDEYLKRIVINPNE